MTITLTALQKQRRDTAANWTAENPTLLAGEIGIESDTGKIKIGTGAAAWNSLAYQGIIPSSGAYPLSQLIMPLGTAAAPAVTFTGDVNTGLYSSGADQVSFSTGGTERLRIDATGQIEAVSLGTAAAPTYTFTGDPNTGIYSPGADQLAISTGGSGRLQISSDGVVTVGPNPSTLARVVIPSSFNSFHLALTTASNGTLGALMDANGGFIGTFAGSTTDALRLGTGGTEKLRITSTGTVNIVGAGSAGSTQAVSFNGSAPVNSLVIDSNGNVGVGESSLGSIRLVVKKNDATTYSSTNFNAQTHVFLNNTTNGGYSNLILGCASSTTGSAAYAGLAVVSEAASDTNGALAFGTRGAGAGNIIERLRITSAGLVGVGASSISEQLQLGQNGSGTDNYIGIWGDQSGSNGEFAGIKFFNNQANSSSTPVKQVASIYAARDGDNFGGALYFQTANPSSGSQTLGTRMLLDSSGRLGIGTGASTPNGTLETKATAGVAPFVASGPSSEYARVDSSGRLLVGTSTSLGTTAFDPYSIQLAGTNDPTSSAGFFRFQANTGASILSFTKSRGASVGTNTIVADGDNVGILNFRGADGTGYIPAAQIACQIDGTPGANDMPGRLVFSTTADGASSPTERMRINAAGDLIYGTGGNGFDAGSGTTDGLYLNNTNKEIIMSRNGGVLITLRRRTSDGTIQSFYRDTTLVGTISVTTTATAYNTSSDYRLKENVTAVTDGITRLQQLKPSRFNFIADPSKTVDGFLAHEAAEVVPECVTGEKDEVDDEGNPIYQGIDQSKLVPLLTAALQEAITKIESLEARIAALEA